MTKTKLGRPRMPVPERLQSEINEMFSLTQEISQLQQEVIRLSKRRKTLVLKARKAGASKGSIAEACGLTRRSYPIRDEGE